MPANLLDGYGTDGATRFKVDSYAAFADRNWKVLPRVTVTGGLRYSYETRAGDDTSFVYRGLAAAMTVSSGAKGQVFWHRTAHSARRWPGRHSVPA